MTTLYEQDFALWSEKMADLIANGHFDKLDIINLVEEIRDLSKRERDQLSSSMRLILHHKKIAERHGSHLALDRKCQRRIYSP